MGGCVGVCVGVCVCVRNYYYVWVWVCGVWVWFSFFGPVKSWNIQILVPKELRLEHFENFSGHKNVQNVKSLKKT